MREHGDTYNRHARRATRVRVRVLAAHTHTHQLARTHTHTVIMRNNILGVWVRDRQQRQHCAHSLARAAGPVARSWKLAGRIGLWSGRFVNKTQAAAVVPVRRIGMTRSGERFRTGNRYVANTLCIICVLIYSVIRNASAPRNARVRASFPRASFPNALDDGRARPHTMVRHVVPRLNIGYE